MAGCIVRCYGALKEKASSYFCFSKAALLMQGLFFSHGFVQLAFLSVMISLIEEISGKKILWYNAVVSTLVEGTSSILVSLMSYDKYGRMFPKTSILITQGIFLTGLLILWLTPSSNIRAIYLVLSLVTVGKAGVRYITFFLERQIMLEHDIDDKKILEDRTKFWKVIGLISGVGTAIGISRRPWKLKFMFSAIAMGIGYLSFCFGLIYYKSERKITNIMPVVSEDNQSRKSSQSWRHLKLLPLWIPFLAYYVVQTAGTTFFLKQIDVVQVDILVKNIKFLDPETCMILVRSFPGVLLRPILKRFSDKKYKLRAALTLGMVFNFCSCIASWHVEARRLHMFKKSGSNMNLFWLVPQFFLLGCAIELVGEGLEDFFSDLVPESKQELGFAFNRLVEGMGKFISVGFVLAFRNYWIGDTINKSRLDNYYRALAFLALGALFLFTYLSNTDGCTWEIDLEKSEEGDAAFPTDVEMDVLSTGNDGNLVSVRV
ncbi:hypothetical protein SLEP1_g58470 [Rubroshorea leprosula]|uniref:Major facilitator superfamily protein n=1 Tax=Rubroshorea leprosula TaxID=152421 RepID=A0AAV5MPD5_9ROSI|nr:hypothetical protein SLEP1_g58470 [Rubroshorea leprosula]